MIQINDTGKKILYKPCTDYNKYNKLFNKKNNIRRRKRKNEEG